MSDILNMTAPIPSKPKRKKTSRACNHCHKSHMTCDANRPCNRCVQRGLQATCEDAPRKRKKYLADVPMDAIASSQYRLSESPPAGQLFPPQSNQNSESFGPISSNNTSILPPSSNPSPVTLPPLTQSQSHPGFNTNQQSQVPPPDGGWLSNNQQPNSVELERRNTAPYLKQEIPLDSDDLMKKRSKFLSSAADLEYSSLSNIISDNFFNASTSNEQTPNSINLSPNLSPMNPSSLNQSHPKIPNQASSPNTAINDAFILNNNSGYMNYSNQGQPQGQLQGHQNAPGTTNTNTANTNTTTTTTKSNYPLGLSNNLITRPIYDNKTLKCDESINQYYLGCDNDDYSKLISLPDITEQLEMLKDTDPSTYYERNSKLTLSVTIGILPDDSPFTRVSDPINDIKYYFKEPEEIYEKVNRPYSYTPGYHSLIAYLRRRFNKEMLVKMAETMASYRPSFIACTNSLKEHDLIFMEQCFQRTLLTYDSIIRVSGTPTIVWRRTGEIAYVGNEFCTLTGWSKQELLNSNKKLIVELLDDKSVLEYFQLFLKIAFGDFLGATMTECTLLAKKHNTKIKTRCSWTLKRDVFGIPMMIIGNFLPIL